MPDKLLTAFELKVMNLLWTMDKAFVKDLLDKWDEAPPPAYNTMSTIVRILQEKGFVGHETFGRTHRYFPKISRGEYQKLALKNMVSDVFSGSVTELLSALSNGKDLSPEEIDELRRFIDKQS